MVKKLKPKYVRTMRITNNPITKFRASNKMKWSLNAIDDDASEGTLSPEEGVCKEGPVDIGFDNMGDGDDEGLLLGISSKIFISIQ